MSIRNQIVWLRNSTRPYRYRFLSNFSERYAKRNKLLLEKEVWETDGYKFSEIMKAQVVESTGAVYLPVSKAANTTMKYLISNEPQLDEVLEDRFQQSKQQSLLASRDMMIHGLYPSGVLSLKVCKLTPNDLAKGTHRCFTVVRHPIERFKSALRDKVLNPRPSDLKNEIAPYVVKDKSKSVADALIRYIKETPTQLMDSHVCPQWSHSGAGRIPIEMVGKVETLETDVKAFTDAGLIPPESIGKIAVRNASNSYEVELTRAQELAIRQLYNRDFEVFGYN